jgi:hypothetical protein
MCQLSSSSSSSSSSSYATCWMLVHAYVTSPGKAKWSGLHHNIKILCFVLFHSVTCYTNSIVSCIHVNTTNLRNIMCTLVATCVVLWSVECINFPTFRFIMCPSHLTLAKPKSWQMMWHALKVEVLSLKHRPSHPSITRHEARM